MEDADIVAFGFRTDLYIGSSEHRNEFPLLLSNSDKISLAFLGFGGGWGLELWPPILGKWCEPIFGNFFKAGKGESGEGRFGGGLEGLGDGIGLENLNSGVWDLLLCEGEGEGVFLGLDSRLGLPHGLVGLGELLTLFILDILGLPEGDESGVFLGLGECLTYPYGLSNGR